MTTWHGKSELKAEVLARMVLHRAEDSIVQGFYQKIDPELASGYRGCLIGCTLPRVARWALPDWHEEVEEVYGIPVWLGLQLDEMFETLPPSMCADFAVKSIESIPVGVTINGESLSASMFNWASSQLEGHCTPSLDEDDPSGLMLDYVYYRGSGPVEKLAMEDEFFDEFLEQFYKTLSEVPVGS